MLHDLTDMPEKENWAALFKWLLGILGFSDVWLVQGVGNFNIYLTLVKERLQDQFIFRIGVHDLKIQAERVFICV